MGYKQFDMTGYLWINDDGSVEPYTGQDMQAQPIPQPAPPPIAPPPPPPTYEYDESPPYVPPPIPFAPQPAPVPIPTPAPVPVANDPNGLANQMYAQPVPQIPQLQPMPQPAPIPTPPPGMIPNNTPLSPPGQIAMASAAQPAPYIPYSEPVPASDPNGLADQISNQPVSSDMHPIDQLLEALGTLNNASQPPLSPPGGVPEPEPTPTPAIATPTMLSTYDYAAPVGSPAPVPSPNVPLSPPGQVAESTPEPVAAPTVLSSGINEAPTSTPTSAPVPIPFDNNTGPITPTPVTYAQPGSPEAQAAPINPDAPATTGFYYQDPSGHSSWWVAPGETPRTALDNPTNPNNPVNSGFNLTTAQGEYTGPNVTYQPPVAATPAPANLSSIAQDDSAPVDSNIPFTPAAGNTSIPPNPYVANRDLSTAGLAGQAFSPDAGWQDNGYGGVTSTAIPPPPNPYVANQDLSTAGLAGQAFSPNAGWQPNGYGGVTLASPFQPPASLANPDTSTVPTPTPNPTPAPNGNPAPNTTGDPNLGYGSLLEPFTEPFTGQSVLHLDPWNQQFNFNYDDFTESPAYKTLMDEGFKTIQRSAATGRGTGLYSGGTDKNLLRFTEGLTANEFNDQYNRALGEYNIKHQNFNENQTRQTDEYGRALNEYGLGYNIFKGNQNDVFNKLSAVSGGGQVASGNLAGLGSNFSSLFSNTSMGNQAAINDFLTSGANATAQGGVGSAAARAGAAGGVGQSINDYLLLKSMGMI